MSSDSRNTPCDSHDIRFPLYMCYVQAPLPSLLHALHVLITSTSFQTHPDLSGTSQPWIMWFCRHQAHWTQMNRLICCFVSFLQQSDIRRVPFVSRPSLEPHTHWFDALKFTSKEFTELTSYMFLNRSFTEKGCAPNARTETVAQVSS